MDETLALARRLAEGPPIAYRYMKENLNRALGGDPFDCMDLEVTHHVHTGLTQDHKQAAQAFVDKRHAGLQGTAEEERAMSFEQILVDAGRCRHDDHAEPALTG